MIFKYVFACALTLVFAPSVHARWQSSSDPAYITPQLTVVGSVGVYLNQKGELSLFSSSIARSWNGFKLPKDLGRVSLLPLPANTSVMCAVSEDKNLICWGEEMQRGVIAQVRQAKRLAIGAQDACVLDADGVRCFGRTAELKKVPPLSHPYALSVLEKTACALDDGGIKCWGEAIYYINPDSKDNSKMLRPNLDAPYDLVLTDQSNSYPQSIILAEGNHTKLWGMNASNIPSDLGRVELISASSESGCAVLGRDQLKCWGTIEKYEKPKNLKNISLLAVGGQMTSCLVDDFGLRCWGYTSSSEANENYKLVLPAELTKSGLSALSFAARASAVAYQYDKLVQYMTAPRGLFLGGVSQALVKLESVTQWDKTRQRAWLKQSQVLSLNLLAPFLVSLSGIKFEEQLVPQVKIAIDSINDEMGYETASDIPLNGRTRFVALSVMKSALDGLRQYVTTEEERSKLDAQVTRVGQALARLDVGYEDARLAARAIRSEPLVTHLLDSPLSRGMAESLIAACNFLDRG